MVALSMREARHGHSSPCSRIEAVRRRKQAVLVKVLVLVLVLVLAAKCKVILLKAGLPTQL